MAVRSKEDKYDKPSLVDRVMLGMMKMGKGKPKTVLMRTKEPIPPSKRMPLKKMEMKTTRTAQVESGLKRAGVTDKEMARFQRSKKGK